jgi:GntR family transcriptional regulator / MocR family aminotransferase
MQIPIVLDRATPKPLADQLADELREAIRQGRVPAGERLPSSRAFADQLGLARNTVVRAYETLAIEGLVESRAASGFFATPHIEDARCLAGAPDRRRSPGAKHAAPASKPMPAPAALPAPQRIGSGAGRDLYDFVPGRPSVELFPVKTWRRLLRGCLSYGGAAGLSEHGEPGGMRALCAALAKHLSIGRGLVADLGQILIVSGVQEGLSITARLFPSAAVFVEDPCYQGATAAFAAAGARLVGVPVDEEGLTTSTLPELPGALLYVTPGHQFPTGHTLSLARRKELIAWARRNGCYIVEDDYDSEFQYEGGPLQALAGMAPDCTIHLGTFSTTLGAGLRLGYVVVPPDLVDAMRAGKALLSGGNPWLDQAVMAEFLKSGSYATHLARSRSQYKESRDALLAALRRHFGTVDVSGESAGLHVCWRLPAGVPEAARLEQLARKNRVGVYSLSSAGARAFGSTALHRRSLLLGYAGLLPKQIEQGIARLSDAVDDALDGDHDFVRELMIDEPTPEGPRSTARLRAFARRALPPRRQPAIRTIAQGRATDDAAPEELDPMRIVRGIYRYPIKGLSAQHVPGVELEAGKPFPFDRLFALARPGVPIDAESPRWAKKGLFLMLMLDEALARVQTHLDVETMHLTVYGRGGESPGSRETLLSVDLSTREGREAAEAFFRRQVPALQGPPKLVRSPDGHFMDKPDNVISCINLATVRSLEAEWGREVNALRFRANLYIEGARPWEEFDWVGSDIMLGDVLFRVDRRNGRCGATNVDPRTGDRDMDIPGWLRKRFGHKDLGVYLVARTGGKVVVGDRVTVPDLEPSHPEPPAFVLPSSGRGSFICRGCYYVYDEARAAPGRGAPLPFAFLGDDWACPDCGTHKGNFRPYLPDLSDPPALIHRISETGH